MTIHYINGKAKLSITAPQGGGKYNTFNVYLSKQAYENMGSPPYGYVYVGRVDGTRPDAPNQLIVALERPESDSKYESRKWQPVAGKRHAMRLGIVTSALDFAVPAYMFRVMELPVSFSREQRRIVFRDVPNKLWAMSEERKFDGYRRGPMRKGSSVHKTSNVPSKTPPAVRKAELPVNGGAFFQGVSDGSGLVSVMGDVNRGLTALRVLGIPHEVSVEDGEVVLQIKEATFR